VDLTLRRVLKLTHQEAALVRRRSDVHDCLGESYFMFTRLCVFFLFIWAKYGRPTLSMNSVAERCCAHKTSPAIVSLSGFGQMVLIPSYLSQVVGRYDYDDEDDDSAFSRYHTAAVIFNIMSYIVVIELSEL